MQQPEPRIEDNEPSSEQLRQLIQQKAVFTSAKCEKCERRANVRAGKIWKCTCEHINPVPTNTPLYVSPEIGPSKEAIQKAITQTLVS